MFESNVPPNLPVEEKKVEDIFTPVESVKPTPPEGALGAEARAMHETPHMGFKRVLFVLGGVVVLALVAGGAYFGLRGTSKRVPKQAQTVEPQVTESNALPEEEATIEFAPEVQPEAPVSTELLGGNETVPIPSIDSDGDGLTDDQETALGTNPQAVDTDNDGLTDREESQVYNSDPLNPDTDGDGFSDGSEVKNGYNPIGSGKLLPQVPQSPPR